METTESKGVVIESLILTETSSSSLVLEGSLHSPSAQTQLAGHFERIHGAIVGGRLPSFSVDVRRLNLVSSSAIRLFVSWISRAEAAGYRLVFFVDRTITWHRLSFSVLSSLAPNTVEVIDRSASEGAS